MTVKSQVKKPATRAKRKTAKKTDKNLTTKDRILGSETVQTGPKNLDARVQDLIAFKVSHPDANLTDGAQYLGCTINALSAMLSRNGIKWGEILTVLQHYKDNRADLLALKQVQILSLLDEEKLKKATAQQLTYAYGVLFDKEQLARGANSIGSGLFAIIVQAAHVLRKDLALNEPKTIEACTEDDQE